MLAALHPSSCACAFKLGYIRLIVFGVLTTKNSVHVHATTLGILLYFLHFIGQIIPKICACMYLFIFLQYIVCTILKYGGGKNHRITQKINGM